MIVPLLTPHFYRASTGVLDDVWDASPGSQTTSKTPVLASLQGNGQNDIYYITGDAWATCGPVSTGDVVDVILANPLNHI